MGTRLFGTPATAISSLQFSPRLKWKKIWEEKKLFHLSSLPTLTGGAVLPAAFGHGVQGKRVLRSFGFIGTVHVVEGSEEMQRPRVGWFDILECLPGFKEAKSLGLIHIHFRLKVKDSQPLLISLSLAELCVQGSLAL